METRGKLLFIGVGDIPWSSNIGMIESSQKLGWNVHLFNYRTVFKEHYSKYSILVKGLVAIIDSLLGHFRRLPWCPNFISGIYYKFGPNYQLNVDLMNLVKENSYDLVFIAKGDRIDPSIIAKARKYSLVAYFFMDPPSVAKSINLQNFVKASDISFMTFSNLAERYSSQGYHSIWVTQGINHHFDSSEKIVVGSRDIDVLFFGSKNRYRQTIVSKLSDLGIDVLCCGTGWQNPPVFGENLIRLVNNSKVILNLCRSEKEGFSVRVVDAIAIGSIVVSDYCRDFEEVFRNGCELHWENDLDKLSLRIKDLLRRSESERDQLRAIAQKMILEKFRWDIKMREIFDHISEIECRER